MNNQLNDIQKAAVNFLLGKKYGTKEIAEGLNLRTQQVAAVKAWRTMKNKR